MKFATTHIIAPPSPDYLSASPDYFPRSDLEFDLDVLPEEDPSEDDSSSDDAFKTTESLAVQATPAPFQIVPTPPTLPHKPAILLQPRQAIPLGRPYRIHPNGWIMAPPPSSPEPSSPPSSEYSSSSLLGSLSSAPSSLYSGPSRRRSRISFTTETSQPSLIAPPHKRHRPLIYLSSSSASLSPPPSVRPSCKRCRPHTLPLPAAPVVSPPPIKLLLPRKRFRDSSCFPHEGVHAEARLTHHGELTREMYDHLLEIFLTRLETTQHELEALRARVAPAE
ncbi:hypothetical protein Tco_0847462 [Tanacetum coccineum]